MKHLFIFAITLLFVACANEDHENSALTVANYWNAEKYSVNDENDGHTIVLNFENLGIVGSKYPKKNIADLSAIKFIEGMAPSAFEGYDSVKINLKNKGESFTNTYKISDLFTAGRYFKLNLSFFMKVKDGNYEDFNSFFDTTKISIENISKLKSLFMRIDSSEGKPTQIAPISFDFKTVDADKKPVIVTHVDVSNPKSFTDYMIVYNIKDSKVIYFGVNQK